MSEDSFQECSISKTESEENQSDEDDTQDGQELPQGNTYRHGYLGNYQEIKDSQIPKIFESKIDNFETKDIQIDFFNHQNIVENDSDILRQQLKKQQNEEKEEDSLKSFEQIAQQSNEMIYKYESEVADKFPFDNSEIQKKQLQKIQEEKKVISNQQNQEIIQEPKLEIKNQPDKEIIIEKTIEDKIQQQKLQNISRGNLNGVSNEQKQTIQQPNKIEVKQQRKIIDMIRGREVIFYYKSTQLSDEFTKLSDNYFYQKEFDEMDFGKIIDFDKKYHLLTQNSQNRQKYILIPKKEDLNSNVIVSTLLLVYLKQKDSQTNYYMFLDEFIKYNSGRQLDAEKLKQEKLELEIRNKRKITNIYQWQLFFLICIKFYPGLCDYLQIQDDYQDEQIVLYICEHFNLFSNQPYIYEFFTFGFQFVYNKSYGEYFSNHMVRFITQNNYNDQKELIEFIIEKKLKWRNDQQIEQLSEYFIIQELNDSVIKYLNDMKQFDYLLVYYLKKNDSKESQLYVTRLKNNSTNQFQEFENALKLVNKYSQYDTLIDMFNKNENDFYSEQLKFITNQIKNENKFLSQKIINYPNIIKLIKEDFFFAQNYQILTKQDCFKDYFSENYIIKFICDQVFNQQEDLNIMKVMEKFTSLLQFVPNSRYQLQKQLNQTIYTQIKVEANIQSNINNFTSSNNPFNLKKYQKRIQMKSQKNWNEEECEKNALILIEDEEKNKIKIQELNSNTEKILTMQSYLFHNFQKELIKVRGKQLILVIGPSGSGKSTFCNGLYYYWKTGEVLLQSNGEVKEDVEIIFKYKDDSNSQTFQPKFVNLSDDILLGDFPGFGDTRGLVLNLFQTIAFKEVILNCSSVKFLFLFSTSNSSNRYKTVQNTFEQFYKVFGIDILKKYHENFLIIINKVQKLEEYEEFISKNDILIPIEEVGNNLNDIYNQMTKQYINLANTKKNKMIPPLECFQMIKEQIEKFNAIEISDNLIVNTFLNSTSVKKIYDIAIELGQQLEKEILNNNFKEVSSKINHLLRLLKLEIKEVEKCFNIVKQGIINLQQEIMNNIFMNLVVKDNGQLNKNISKLKQILKVFRNMPEFCLLKYPDFEQMEKNFIAILGKEESMEQMINLLKDQLKMQRTELVQKNKDQKKEFQNKMKGANIGDPRTIYQLIEDLEEEILTNKMKYFPEELKNKQLPDYSYVNHAYQTDKSKIFDLLIKNGFDFNEQEKNVTQNIFQIIESQDVKKLKLFFYWNEKQQIKNINGIEDALFLIVQRQDVDMIKLMKEKQISLNVKKDGFTLLSIAIEQNDSKMIEQLMDDVDLLNVDSNGFNELMRAMLIEKEKIQNRDPNNLRKSEKQNILDLLWNKLKEKNLLEQILKQKTKKQNNILHLASGITDNFISKLIKEELIVFLCNELNLQNQYPLMLFIQNQNDLATRILEQTSKDILMSKDVNSNSIFHYILRFCTPIDQLKYFQNQQLEQLLKSLKSPNIEEIIIIIILNQYNELCTTVGKLKLNFNKSRILEFKPENKPWIEHILAKKSLIKTFLLINKSFLKESIFFNSIFLHEEVKTLIKEIISIKDQEIDNFLKTMFDHPINGIQPLDIMEEKKNKTMIKIMLKSGADPKLLKTLGPIVTKYMNKEQ